MCFAAHCTRPLAFPKKIHSTTTLFHDHARHHPTQSIDLLSTETELEPFEVYNMHAFRIETDSWKKKGDDINQRRPFIFALDESVLGIGGGGPGGAAEPKDVKNELGSSFRIHITCCDL